MAKVKKAFFCSSCGFESPQWLGKCPSCNEWNTFQEELLTRKSVAPFSKNAGGKSKAVLLNEVEKVGVARLDLQNEELGRVMGGGLVPGSLTLIGGEPGVGKSTLLLQLALQEKDFKVLYISGEESESQIALRAERITGENPNLFVLAETSLNNILTQVRELSPSLIIIDSIQTLHSELIESPPGSVSQIKQCTAECLRLAKESGVPVVLVGHITKDGGLAGPKVLEHMVDTVLQFEGDRNNFYRLLRVTKNRFGNTSEIGIFEMKEDGLKVVDNPNELLLSEGRGSLSGACTGVLMEGMRPLLIEVQALVSTAVYGNPQRSTTGFDQRRLNMLLAVLEKRCGFKLGAKDVFLNVIGGIRVDDPALDLSIVSAILSSNADIVIPAGVACLGEVGLNGEIRNCSKIEQRVVELDKLGFEKVIIPENAKIEQTKLNIEVVKVGDVGSLIRNLFA